MAVSARGCADGNGDEHRDRAPVRDFHGPQPATASAVYGESLTVTATVTGSGTPTGTVVLYLGIVNPADQIGTGTLSVVSGQDQVTFSIPTLHVSGSPYQLTAVYGGDGNHQGSTSNAAGLTITPASLTITANNQTKVYGQAESGPDGQLLGVRQWRHLGQPHNAADGHHHGHDHEPRLR